MPTYNVPTKTDGQTLPAADWNSSATAVNDLGTIVDLKSDTGPTAGGTWCWVCTTSGTPGIWSAFTLN